MTMRPIRLLGDAVLRTAADPVTSFDAELRGLVADLMDTLLGAPGRAGVAAPQIGVPARVFVYLAGERRGHLVNPTIEVSGEVQNIDEGCLSLPGLWFPTPRATQAVARGFDQHGELLTIAGTGLLAQTLQHETDHLDGVLYVDKLTGQTRREALRAVRSAPWAGATRQVRAKARGNGEQHDGGRAPNAGATSRLR
jgi:peptide deformylase